MKSKSLMFVRDFVFLDVIHIGDTYIVKKSIS